MRGVFGLRVGTLGLAIALATTAAGQQYTDPFDSRRLDPMWTFRSTDDRAEYEIKGGRVTLLVPDELNLSMDRDTSAPMLLTRPPADDDHFSIETYLTVVNRKGVLPLGGYTGLIMMRDDLRAYVWWGAVFNTAVGGDRWDGRSLRSYGAKGARFDTSIGLRIEKRGAELLLFYRHDYDQEWREGGTPDEGMRGPDLPVAAYFEPGTYKVGVYVASGTKRVNVAFDYFDSPELTRARPVDGSAKAAVTWGRLKAD